MTLAAGIANVCLLAFLLDSLVSDLNVPISLNSFQMLNRVLLTLVAAIVCSTNVEYCSLSKRVAILATIFFSFDRMGKLVSTC